MKTTGNSVSSGTFETVEPKELFKPTEPSVLFKLRKLQDYLHISTKPSRFIAREKEFKQVHDFIAKGMDTGKGDSMYVCGSPGVGKTLCLQFAVDTIKADPAYRTKIKVVQLNAMRLADPKDIYSTLYRLLGGRKGQGAPTTAVEYADAVKAMLSTEGKRGRDGGMTLIVVDEIDFLLSKAQTVLYRLFEWPRSRSSAMMLIGIANSIDLTNRFLPRLKQRFCEPKLLVFGAYNKDQLMDIVSQRIRESEREVEMASGNESDTADEDAPAALTYFQKAAVELCARKVASRSGDVRKCLDICGQCVQALEDQAGKEGREEEGDTTDTQKPSLMVKVGDMMRCLSKTMGSPVEKTMKHLPAQQQTVLCVAAIVTKHQDDVKVYQLREQYLSMTKGYGLPRLSAAMFSDIVSALSVSGLVKVTSSKSARSKQRVVQEVTRLSQVAVCVAFDELRQVLAPLNTFFTKILDRGETSAN